MKKKNKKWKAEAYSKTPLSIEDKMLKLKAKIDMLLLDGDLSSLDRNMLESIRYLLKKRLEPLQEEKRLEAVDTIKKSLETENLSELERAWHERLLDILEGRGFPFQNRPQDA